MSEEKKEYLVRMPFAGSMSVVVETETEEEAIEKAKEIFSDIDAYRLDFKSKGEVELDEWDIYDKLVQGNIVYPSCYEIEVEEM